MTANFAVVLGLSPTGLYALRELGAAGIAVYGNDDEIRCGHYSRYLSEAGAVQQLAAGDELLHWLQTLSASRGERGVLIPSSDRYIEWLITHSEVLTNSNYVFQSSYSSTRYRELVQKDGLAKLCGQLDIATPRTQLINPALFSAATADIRYPCLLKPAEIHRVVTALAGRKVLLANSEQELTQQLRRARELPVQWLLQEIVPGPESELVLFAAYVSRGGDVRQAFCARKLRQYPPGFGSASLVLEEPLEEVAQLSKTLLGAIAYQGIVGLEFKRDPSDGAYKLIEINPRPTLWFAAAGAAGRRIVESAYADLLGKTMPPEPPSSAPVLWRYGLKDIYSQLFYRLKRPSPLPPPQIRRHIPKRYQRVFAVADRGDWRPLWGELSNYARKAWRRLFAEGGQP